MSQRANSSSSSGSSRRGSKRLSNLAEMGPENDAPQPDAPAAAVAVAVNPNKTYIFSQKLAEKPEKLVQVAKPTAGNEKAWDRLTEDAQEVCIRRVMRLFLTKGARREVVKYVELFLYLLQQQMPLYFPNSDSLLVIFTHRKDTILKVLKDVDPSYGSCATSVVAICKKELKKSFGYDLSSRFTAQEPTEVKGASRASTSTEFILFNGLRSAQLQDILADAASVNNKAWMGFVFVVLQIINSSAAKTTDSHTLLSKVREIDDRFPESRTKSTSSSGVPVPELGADFPNLMKRMVNERYVVVRAKDKKENREDTKIEYTFGARFYAEFGRKQVITSYFQTLGQRVDIAMLDDAAQAEQEMYDDVGDEEEKEEEQQGAEGVGPQVQDDEAEADGGASKKGRKKRKSS